jgi:Kef-type K+ transport system membrane component KefB/nucleotide-binding universal stress UspA family protein
LASNGEWKTLDPLTDHQLLIFWLQLLVLVATARGLGGLMKRIGQPAVVGELAAGLLIGPSVLGRVAPGVFEYLFPVDPVNSGLLLSVSWIGVALLLVVTGFETDLKLLARLGRSSLTVSIGSLLVPLVFGYVLGTMLPDIFYGENGTRVTFAAFMGVALSISALPVVAKILMDMNLMRRNIGQVIVAAGMANDLIGWILLGTLAGVVTSGAVEIGKLATTVGAMALFIVGMLTIGQRVVDAALRRARQGSSQAVSGFTVAILAMLAAGSLTQALHVEAVLGAFVAGIVLGRSRYQSEEVTHTIEVATHSFFAPVFFATAGLFVDLGLLADPTTALWAGAVVAVGAAAKLIGSYAGARIGGMTGREGLAVGVGLNARGAIEIVIATVGLSLGVLNPRSYTVVVVLAMSTSMMAPPLLRAVLRRVQTGGEETARLEREAVMESSVVANTRTALLPTRGGANSVLAARVLEVSLQPDTAVTVLTVHGENEDDAANRADIAAREAGEHFTDRKTERLDRLSDDPAGAICNEAKLGYGLVAIGMTENYAGGHTMSPVLSKLLSECTVPILLVKGGRDLDPHAHALPFQRIMVPAIGTKVGQAAQEIAYTLAERVDAQVDVVHVVSRPDRVPEPVTVPPTAQDDSVSGMLEEARSLASKFGREVNALTRNGPSVGMELAITADEEGADLLVLGAKVRSYSGQPFLGHGIEYLLEHSDQTVIVVVFPARLSEAE